MLEHAVPTPYSLQVEVKILPVEIIKVISSLCEKINKTKLQNLVQMYVLYPKVQISNAKPETLKPIFGLCKLLFEFDII